MVIIEFCLTLGKFPFRYSLEPKETYSNLDKFGQKLLSGNTTANLESKQSWRYYQMKFIVLKAGGRDFEILMYLKQPNNLKKPSLNFKNFLIFL